MTQKFCEHQSCESYQTPRCTAYIFNKEHPLCAFTSEDFAFHNCKAFKKLPPQTIEERLDTLERMITCLERKLNHHIDIEILCKNPNKED
jgi:hypothetical protein